jgi:hypothetical protein
LARDTKSNEDAGLWIIKGTSAGVDSGKRRERIPGVESVYDVSLLDGDVYHKKLNQKRTKVYTASENGKNRPVRRNVEYSSDETKWLHAKLAGITSKHYSPTIIRWLGEFGGDAYFHISGVWDGQTEHFGVLVWDKNKKVQFIVFPPVKGRGEVLDFNLNAKAPAIGPDGSVYYMVGTDSGMSVFKWPVHR